MAVPRKHTAGKKLTKVESQKHYLTALWLSSFLGVVGADRLYLGYRRSAILKLLTLGGLGVWLLIDWLRIIAGVQTDKAGKRLQGTAENHLSVQLSIGVVCVLTIIGVFFDRHTLFSNTAQVSGPSSTTVVVALVVLFGLLAPALFSALLGYALFLIFTIVDACRRRQWVWAILNVFSMLLSLPFFNLVYYFWIRKKPAGTVFL